MEKIKQILLECKTVNHRDVVMTVKADNKKIQLSLWKQRVLKMSPFNLKEINNTLVTCNPIVVTVKPGLSRVTLLLTGLL